MSNHADHQPFYVGYLPLPHAIKRFVVPWLAGNFVLVIGVALLLAQQHRAPGDGVWDTGQLITREGILLVDPYPVLWTHEGDYILVEQGKYGVQRRMTDGGILPGPVKAHGFLIEREGRRVFELDGSISNALTNIDSLEQPLGDGLSPLQAISDRADQIIDLGRHTLRGEIVDPKCYLGVMQPGDGKTHKICATLCISGGIPPMFVVKDGRGNWTAYLLTDSRGEAFPQSHYEYIAEPIAISGRVLRDGGLLILQADLASFRRLGARFETSVD